MIGGTLPYKMVEEVRPLLHILPAEQFVLAYVADQLDWDAALAVATERDQEAADQLAADVQTVCSLARCPYQEALKGILEMIDDAGEQPDDPNDLLTEVYQYIEYTLDGIAHVEVSND